MRAVGYKGGKERHNVKEDICYSLDDGVRLLTLVERVAQAGVDCDDFVNIPKDLLDKVSTTVFGDDIRRAERGYPNLCPYQHAPNEEASEAGIHRASTPYRARNRARYR